MRSAMNRHEISIGRCRSTSTTHRDVIHAHGHTGSKKNSMSAIARTTPRAHARFRSGYRPRMPDQTPLSIHAPDGSPTGGVVVVQEAFGVNDHIEDVCTRIAAAGYLAMAPHLFHRTGDPKLGYTDFDQVMPHMKALTADGVLADVDAAL